jgi:DNA repair protein RadC
MPPRITPEIHNFDRVKTIYRAKFRTLIVKLDGAFGRAVTTMGVPSAVEEVLQAAYANLDDEQEHFLILILDDAHEIKGYKVVASGSYDRVSVSLGLVYRNALLLGARAVICAHNHPRGNLEPTPSDLKLTRLLIRGGKSVEIEFLDHYIYTPRACSSIRERHPHLWPAAKKPKKRSTGKDVK